MYTPSSVAIHLPRGTLTAGHFVAAPHRELTEKNKNSEPLRASRPRTPARGRPAVGFPWTPAAHLHPRYICWINKDNPSLDSINPSLSKDCPNSNNDAPSLSKETPI